MSNYPTPKYQQMMIGGLHTSNMLDPESDDALEAVERKEMSMDFEQKLRPISEAGIAAVREEHAAAKALPPDSSLRRAKERWLGQNMHGVLARLSEVEDVLAQTYKKDAEIERLKVDKAKLRNQIYGLKKYQWQLKDEKRKIEEQAEVLIAQTVDLESQLEAKG